MKTTFKRIANGEYSVLINNKKVGHLSRITTNFWNLIKVDGSREYFESLAQAKETYNK
jgi:hypothetical protein